MTLQHVRTRLRAYGITCTRRPSTDEYRVNVVGGTEDSAYYTNDLGDAFGTGVDMARRLGRVETWPSTAPRVELA